MQLWDWTVFKNALTTSFAAPDKPGDAITKMETETMTSGTADKFIERFKINANDSGVTQDRPLIEWFMKGINASLLDKILNPENPPTTIVDWYTTASKLDNQWRRGQAIANRLKAGADMKKKGFRFPNKSTP